MEKAPVIQTEASSNPISQESGNRCEIYRLTHTLPKNSLRCQRWSMPLAKRGLYGWSYINVGCDLQCVLLLRGGMGASTQAKPVSGPAAARALPALRRQ